jgi:hypothetical protein
MGLIYGEWIFAAGTVPAPAAVASALAEATGLEVRLLPSDAAPDEAISVELPQLGEKLVKWRREGDRLAVHGFVPAHPYLWENLDTVMVGLGGACGPAEHGWRPQPDHAGLRRPWAGLTPAQRVLMQLPTLGAWRPLDSLAARRR